MWNSCKSSLFIIKHFIKIKWKNFLCGYKSIRCICVEEDCSTRSNSKDNINFRFRSNSKDNIKTSSKDNINS